MRSGHSKQTHPLMISLLVHTHVAEVESQEKRIQIHAMNTLKVLITSLIYVLMFLEHISIVKISIILT